MVTISSQYADEKFYWALKKLFKASQTDLLNVYRKFEGENLNFLFNYSQMF